MLTFCIISKYSSVLLLLWIIFTSTYFFIKHSRSAETRNGVLIDFRCWTNSSNMFSPQGIVTSKKSWFSHIFLHDLSLLLFEWRQFRQWESPSGLGIIFHNNIVYFFTVRICHPYFLESIKKKIFFSCFELCFW